MKKQDVNLILDIGLMSCIFFMTVLEISSFYFSFKYDVIKYDNLNPYVFYYAPLLNALTTLMAGSFFLFKIIRFKSCFLTKTITIAFFTDQLITVILIYNGYSHFLYTRIIYPIYLLTMLILFGFFVLSKIKPTLK